MIAGELEGHLSGPWSALHDTGGYDNLFGLGRKRKTKKPKKKRKNRAQEAAERTLPYRMVKIASKPFEGFGREELPDQLPSQPAPKSAPIPVAAEPEPEEKKQADVGQTVADTLKTAKELKEAATRQTTEAGESSDYDISVGAGKPDAPPPPEETPHWGWYVGAGVVTLLLIGGAIALKVKQNRAAAQAAAAAVAAATG